MAKKQVGRVREPRIRTLKGLGSATQKGWPCVPEYAPTGVKLYLTGSQCKVFANGPFLGSGAHAVAFEHPTDPGKVVKFTTDENDAKAAAILKGKTLKGAAKVYDVAKLENVTVDRLVLEKGRPEQVDKPVYGIITERMNPLTNVSEDVGVAVDAFNETLGDEQQYFGPLKPGAGFRLRKDFNSRALGMCQTLARLAKVNDVCAPTLATLRSALEEVAVDGGIFTVDVHRGNWGERADGSFALIDFGVSENDPAKVPLIPTLAKAPKARRMAGRRRTR